jgi:acyl-CoA thioesterase-1
MIEANSTVLFQGDSITDAGRIRDQHKHLGGGYAMMAAAWFNAWFPENGVTFLNRGISGNCTGDLVSRWEQDCIALKPNVVSILIGINDTWRTTIDDNTPTTAAEFEANYHAILARTAAELAAELIILEPFVLPNQARYADTRRNLNEKIDVARRLAREFNATYIPLDGMLQSACTRVAAEHWSEDGVHLTPAGNALVAQIWLDTVCGSMGD